MALRSSKLQSNPNSIRCFTLEKVWHQTYFASSFLGIPHITFSFLQSCPTMTKEDHKSTNGSNDFEFGLMQDHNLCSVEDAISSLVAPSPAFSSGLESIPQLTVICDIALPRARAISRFGFIWVVLCPRTHYTFPVFLKLDATWSLALFSENTKTRDKSFAGVSAQSELYLMFYILSCFLCGVREGNHMDKPKNAKVWF